ncbi:MAG: hypothetical protein ABIP89_25680, partial [Polyangiaceae bacterium]
ALGCLISACGASAPAPTQGPEPAVSARDVAEIHRARCGNCHVRVEKGTRTHAALEDAFTRHRKRVHMSEQEWTQMADYLASDGTR